MIKNCALLMKSMNRSLRVSYVPLNQYGPQRLHRQRCFSEIQRRDSQKCQIPEESQSTASSQKQTPVKKEVIPTKYIIHSFPNEKDTSPSTLEIDKHSGKINVVTAHDPVSVKQFRSNIYNGFWDTFLPAGYPHSVGNGYLKFTMYSNISALAITAMSFLSAQSLFVAIGR